MTKIKESEAGGTAGETDCTLWKDKGTLEKAVIEMLGYTDVVLCE